MEKVAQKHTIFSQYLRWYLFDQPGFILKAWKNLLKFNLEYFSIPLLLKTFFSPWRKYTWSYGRGFGFQRYLEAFVSNAIFRGLGAILRLVLILIGIFLEIFVFFVGLAALIIWFLLPFILLGLFILGFVVIF